MRARFWATARHVSESLHDPRQDRLSRRSLPGGRASAPARASSNFYRSRATRGGIDTCLLGIDDDFECVPLLDEAVSAVGILLLVNHF